VSALRVLTRDERLVACVIARSPLHYDDGPDRAADRPGHVRAASALVRLGRGYVVVQDDALFLAGLEGPAVSARALPSPDGVRQFDDARGNKAHKADFEAACVWPTPDGPALVVFGSGSTPRRERLLIARGADPARFIDGAPLYRAVRAALPEGAPLNLEGAFQTAGGGLRLLQRGNGAGGVDATIDLDGRWLDALEAGHPPAVTGWARWSLGVLGGVPLTFTDGCPLSEARWMFCAAAEASPDAVADGPVAGSALGWADDAGGAWAPLTDARGDVVACKVEGLARVSPGEALVVVDADDPEVPSELLRVRLTGPWPS
jgi:hypothetical protein